METASGPISMDRSEEFYQTLEQSPDEEVRMELLQFDYILSPASTHRKVYGPADLYARRWADGDISVHVIMAGKRPKPPKVYASEAEQAIEEDR